jgi:hypothetical protein
LSDVGSGALANWRRPANCQSTAGEKLSIERADSSFGQGIFFELDEPEASRPAGRAILDDFNYACLEALRKKPLRQSLFRLRVWDVPDKQSIQSDLRFEFDYDYAAARILYTVVRQNVGVILIRS